MIREPVPGRIDFVHRTVQEYLAAKQAADLGDMDLLIRNAHLDAWRETVVMAAGHANEPLRRELISGILDRAASEPRRARILRLVAASCLETLPSLPDDLRADLDRCLDSLTPPRSIAAARSLAAIGEPALTRLPEALVGMSEPAARAAIHLARLVNGPAALDVLSRYGSDPRSMVQYELDQAWKYFDPEEYAVRVLTGAPPGVARQVDLSPAMAKALRLLPPLTDLTVQTREPADLTYLGHHAQSVERLAHYATDAAPAPNRLADLPRLRELVLDQPGLATLRFLDDLPELEQIWIVDCADITDFEPLKRHRRLHTLVLFGSRRLTDVTMLPPLERLDLLALSSSQLRCDLSDIVSRTPQLQHLVLDNCEWVRDLSPLAPLPLVHLRLALVDPVSNIDALATLSALRTLHLSGNAVRDLSLLTSLRHLRTLYLRECPNVSDLACLSELPRLQRLHIESIGPGVDLEPLAANRKLAVTISPGQTVRGGVALGRRLKVLSE